jgi:catechol 2,3-dioxygenase-like lactoylglutathione lyase family enzyme
MSRIRNVVLAATVAALMVQGWLIAQAGELATARVSHLGVVVKDMDATLREYSRVMGFEIPKVNVYPIPVPDGRKAEFKLATLYMPNFYIELTQPLNNIGPYYDHLQAHGMSIMHLGVTLGGSGSVDELRSGWERQGGIWTLGEKGGTYAYVNFPRTLGTTLELVRSPGAPGAPPAMPAGDALPPLGALNVSHVGFAASDTKVVTETLAQLFGTAPPKVMEYKDAQYPPDANWSKTAFLRLAMMNQGGTGVEVIESVGGPTPWSESVAKQKGTAAQHLAINVGNRIDEMIMDLVAKGGKWTNGKPGGGYAYLDFSDSLGLIFELNGTSKSVAAAK